MARTKLKLKSIASGTIPGRIKIANENITAGSVDSDAMGAGAISPAKLSAFAQRGGGNKNILINGAMNVAQRYTSKASVSSGDFFVVDRFGGYINATGTWTVSQSTDTPTGQGFGNSAKFDCTSANGSLGSGAELQFRQRIEGFNLQHLKKGTSSAAPTTLQFWVKSNKTGTYICELFDNDNSGRHINKSYTISSANTWEKKTITFAGDTTGALGNDNGTSLTVIWWLGAGSGMSSGTLQTSWGTRTDANRAAGNVNLADSTDNEWYITGVQFEVGDVATEFEHEPFERTLAKCQRYFYQIGYPDKVNSSVNVAMGYYLNGSRVDFVIDLPVTMRAVPAISANSGTNYYSAYTNGDDYFDAFDGINAATAQNFTIYRSSQVSGNYGYAVLLNKTASGLIAADAEL